MANTVRCRALKSIKATDDDTPGPEDNRKWHVPGKPSAVFETTYERFGKLQEQRAVTIVDDEPDLPADEQTPGALPEHFPHRKHLIAAGLRTIAQVQAVVDLTEIPGIGEAGAEQITDALEEL